MFDIGAAELLVLVIVAVIVIGPKDMPLALRTVGRWVGKVRRVSAHFRTGFDAMVREAELEEMEKKWKSQNEAIMAKTSAETPADPQFGKAPESDSDQMTGPPAKQEGKPEPKAAASSEPELPLGSSDAQAKQGE